MVFFRYFNGRQRAGQPLRQRARWIVGRVHLPRPWGLCGDSAAPVVRPSTIRRGADAAAASWLPPQLPPAASGGWQPV